MMPALVLPTKPWPFLYLYVRRHLPLALGTLAAVAGGALCAVAAQYGLKMLVDRMAGPAPAADLVPLVLDVCLFLGLLAGENAFWRVGGWLGSRTIIRIGADIRLDLFDHLTGQSWRFFTR